MLTPQFVLPIHRELVVDLFAGGGGASTGLELAIRRPVDIAVNHDREAVALHLANHPQTKHYVSDVFEVDPREVTQGQPVGFLWASPDCTFHSKARGGKPLRDRNQARRRRALAWVVVKWAKIVRPRVIALENVEEFQQWGPLLEDGQPCPERRGQSFQRWVTQLRNLGYVVQWKELRGCDYGAPTIRKRLFLIARCDGQPIVWPKATHAAPAKARALGLAPWRTAADCIDWSLPCPSIFERERELADTTKKRIAKGVMRYVVNDPNPFIVPSGYGERAGQQPRTQSIHQPLNTIVAANKHALVAPTLIGIDNGSARSASWSANDPLRTTTTENRHALVMAFLAQHNNHKGNVPHTGRRAADPMSTITTRGTQQQLVASSMVKLRGSDVEHRAPGARTDEPLHTISAQGWHHGEVRAFLVKYFGTDQDPRLGEPMHTVTTKHRFGLVTVRGEEYAIVDIGMRMLSARELYTAQGFPTDYIIEWGIDPHTGQVIELTKTAQVRMCGNSVCPQLSQAIAAANYADEAVVQKPRRSARRERMVA
jgi:DNA (cytosine-5)-methyltransferase 1